MKQKTPVYYGWIILAISATSMFFSGPGQTYSISVFIDYYINDFGLSRSLVSSIYSFATLLSGCLLFIMGRMIDRFGHRKVTFIVALMLGFTCLWNSFIVGPIMLFIGFFMLRYWGQGSLVLLPSTLVPQWFIKQRGRAFSFLNIGGFMGALSIPALNTWLIYTWGWPTTWRIWAVVIILGFAPLAYYLIRNKPEDMGLLPDSPSGRELPRVQYQTMSQTPNKSTDHSTHQSTDQSTDESSAPPGDPSIVEESWTLGEAIRTRAFWFILISVCVPSMVGTGIIFHLFSIFSENGLSRAAAPLVLGIMPFASFATSFVGGFLIERFKLHYILALAFIGYTGSMIVLLFSFSLFTAILFAIAIGASNGFIAVGQGVVWPNYYGRKHIGSIKSIVMTALVIASALGPLPFGVAFDYFQSYTEIIILMTMAPTIADLLMAISPPPKYFSNKA